MQMLIVVHNTSHNAAAGERTASWGLRPHLCSSPAPGCDMQVLIVIRSNFQDAAAAGRIENINSRAEYTEQEAREGFSRAKHLHGW